MVVPPGAFIVMVGVTGGVITIVNALLVMVAGDGQVALEVSWQVITSPFARADVVKGVPVAIFKPFFFH